MKKIVSISMVLLFVFLNSFSISAQEKNKDDKKVKIKMIKKNEKGELVKIDTSFTLEDGQKTQEVIDKIMKENADLQGVTKN